MRNVRAFTLIELLVVISIIGLLSSVVMASLQTARYKARDAAMKAQLNQMRTAAELDYSTTGDYSAVCNPTDQTGIMFNNAFQQTDKVDATDICISMKGTAYYLCHGLGGSITCGTGTSNSEPSGDKWAAVVLLKDGNYFCVDYTGKAQEQSSRTLDGSPTTVHCQ